MKVLQVTLKDFRNYEHACVNFSAGKNIVIGENAQGKSNLLEAIELCAAGRSSRAEQDLDFINWGKPACRLDLLFESSGNEETISFEIIQKAEQKTQPSSRTSKIQKIIKVNGVTQTSARGLLGRLPFVSFKTNDLNILRGGPKFRREWLDSIGLRLKPSYHDSLSNYAKSLAQRNRLLKIFAERGRFTAQDQDELLVWDKQLTRFGTQIIKMRLKLLADLLPLAQTQQTHLSRANELLSVDYIFRSANLDEQDEERGTEETRSLAYLSELSEIELAKIMARLLKQVRPEELRRKQSLVGPHRDDLLFRLNGASATAFASQGQQRSLVLALKMAELQQTANHISHPPIFLLDDVLAELDTFRQALLLSAVNNTSQTIITTTHLSGFDPSWLEDARIMNVYQGKVEQQEASLI